MPPRLRHTHVSSVSLLAAILVLLFVSSAIAQAPASRENSSRNPPALSELVATPALSGYESELSALLRARLAFAHPSVDNLGDVIVTFGSGSPSRLIVAPLDEPGYVVSGITQDGYLRLQSLPQFSLPPVFYQLSAAQPVRVRASSGKWISGVTSGLSVHLQPPSREATPPAGVEDLYVDIGAASAAEVRRAGVDNLSPVLFDRRAMQLGPQFVAGPAVADRFAAEALARVIAALDPAKIKGTLTFAFVVQQHTGSRGLQRILRNISADELVYVGPLLPGRPVEGVQNMRRAPRREPGSGVLVGVAGTDGSLSGLDATLQNLAASAKIPFAADFSASILPRSYLPLPSLPALNTHLAVAVGWPETPAEEISFADLDSLASLLSLYAQGSPLPAAPPAAGASTADGKIVPPSKPLPMTDLLRALTESYGVSDHEAPVRSLVKSLLPAWARPDTDDAGNLILQAGIAPAESKSPRILVVAHLDEIGFTVKSISDDGRLEVSEEGGGEHAFYFGHPALVHSANGDHDAVMELPPNWDRPDFKWPEEDSAASIRVDVGARSPAEAEKLGVRVGDSVTIPKRYRPLLASRANARAFDDRVGDAALISAVWSFGGPLKDRDVTFVWSTGEELGLVGAAKLAKRLSDEGRLPDYVFAIDTFVSADSPLESRRFGDAHIGDGFVVRAVDNSNIVPAPLVEKVLKLARSNQIPVQFGVTGGGNDGSSFVPYGSVDVALGWPLRYSHSPAEVIDTRDAESLARIVSAIARSW